MMKLVRETDDGDERTLDATVSSCRAFPFTLVGGHMRAVMMGPCLAGTALALRIPSILCTAAVIESMYWRNSAPLLFIFCSLLFLVVVALALAVFTFSMSAD